MGQGTKKQEMSDFSNIRLLLLEGNEIDRIAFEWSVRQEQLPYDFVVADSVSEAKKIINAGKIGVIISDYRLVDGTVFDILALKTDIPVIIVTATGSEEIAVKALKSGASDYLVKDIEKSYLKTLPSTIDNAMQNMNAKITLKKAEQTLRLWAGELEEMNRDISLLADMNKKLLNCRNETEVCTSISRFFELLLPDESGSIYMLNDLKFKAESIVLWGESPPEEHDFYVDDCNAIRMGEIRFVSPESRLQICRHIEGLPSGYYLCIPLISEKEVIGVMHIRGSHSKLSGLSKYTSPTRQEFITAFSESIAICLANLKLKEDLRSQAIRDPLTGIYNRRYMMEAFKSEISRAKRRKWQIGVMMLDIDYFKNFNDSYGHEAGDTILAEIGKYLQLSVRAEDIPCRYGGEEFLLILPDCPSGFIEQKAEQIRKEVKELKIKHGKQSLGTITVSIGISFFPEHGSSVDALLNSADAAMYKAKSLGRDRAEVAVMRRGDSANG